MNHAALVRVREGIGHVHPPPHHVANLERTAGDLRGQRLAVHVLHGDEGRAPLGADLVDRADGRVVQRGRTPGFARSWSSRLLPRPSRSTLMAEGA